MTAILLVAHAPFASALQSVARHVYPDCAVGLAAVDVDPAATPAQSEQSLRQALALFSGQDVLILSDVFGATPCNLALKVADGVHVRVVAGVNVPMLWRSLCYGAEPLDALVARAVSGAVQGVMQVAVPKPQNQNPTTVGHLHDQVQRSHQQ